MEETATATPTLFKHGLRWAIINAVIGILITIILYVVDYTLLVQLKTLLVSLLIYMGLAIYAGIDYRNSVGGYLSYGKAWQHAMVIFAVSAFIATLFNLLFYNVIDPELPGKLTEASMENTREMMIGFGAPEDQIDKSMEEARKRTENQFTPSGMAMGYGFILIFSAIMASITSLFVRRSEPLAM
jgi:hypothetical protein